MKPIDTIVAAKLVSVAIFGATYQGLAQELHISSSEAHAAAQRLVKAGLFKPQERRVPFPNKRALLEFWIHGLKYLYPPEIGGMGRGKPTVTGAEPLLSHFASSVERSFIWPTAAGTARGPILRPIHPSALPASEDARVYELLTLLDALRAGKQREQQMAEQFLKERLYWWS